MRFDRAKEAHDKCETLWRQFDRSSPQYLWDALLEESARLVFFERDCNMKAMRDLTVLRNAEDLPFDIPYVDRALDDVRMDPNDDLRPFRRESAPQIKDEQPVECASKRAGGRPKNPDTVAFTAFASSCVKLNMDNVCKYFDEIHVKLPARFNGINKWVVARKTKPQQMAKWFNDQHSAYKQKFKINS
jgi:hypothetical protein